MKDTQPDHSRLESLIRQIEDAGYEALGILNESSPDLGRIAAADIHFKKLLSILKNQVPAGVLAKDQRQCPECGSVHPCTW